MAKSKIEVVGAYVDGHGPGSIIEVEENSARYLVEIGYAKPVTTSKATKEGKTEEPAKKASKTTKSKGGKSTKK
jgi:hypothetical protein